MIIPNCICIIVIIVISYICTCIRFNNKILNYLTKMSSEIYFMQFIWLKVCDKYIDNAIWLIISVLLMTILSAGGLYVVIKPLNRLKKLL